jgi:glycerol kinase
LPLDPYFSAGKLAWLLANDDAVRGAREAGALRLGTVDAFLVDRLGGRFATDLSTASRTQLLAAGGHDWDEQLLAAFGVRREWLPAIGPTFGTLGELRYERWPVALPLAAQLVDQQAALAGSGAVRAGELKATYGTACSCWGARTGRYEPTVCCRPLPGPRRSRAAGQTPPLAARAGVLVLPALAGLGAPWWHSEAHGVIAGLHPGVGPAHVARDGLEAIAWRVADTVEAMAQSAPVESLRVDGGLTNDETLLRIQADALGLPLLVGRTDTTVLGAAMLAGVGGCVFASVEDAARRLPQGRTVQPRIGSRERLSGRSRWRAFVQASTGL